MVLTLGLQAADWPPQNETQLLEIPYYNIVEGDKTLDMGLLKMIYDVEYTHLLSNYVPKSIKDIETLGSTRLGRASISPKLLQVCLLQVRGCRSERLGLLLKGASRVPRGNGSWEWQKAPGTSGHMSVAPKTEIRTRTASFKVTGCACNP